MLNGHNGPSNGIKYRGRCDMRINAGAPRATGRAPRATRNATRAMAIAPRAIASQQVTSQIPNKKRKSP